MALKMVKVMTGEGRKTTAFCCKACGEVSVSFHFGVCDDCTKKAVEMLLAAKGETK